jgi:transcriptional regulator with XRE-family HTH domain
MNRAQEATPERARLPADGSDGAQFSCALGRRIRELRKQLCCTQEELANRAGISVSFLSMIERGERLPHLETLAQLAESLGRTLAELFAAVDGKRPSTANKLRPLIAFLRSRHLDQNDVDRLLTVAKVLFKPSK